MKAIFALLPVLITTLNLSAETYVLKLSELDFEHKKGAISSELNMEKSYSNWSIYTGNLISARTPETVHAYLAPKLTIAPKESFRITAVVGDLLIAFDTSSDEAFHGYLDIPARNSRNPKITSFRFSFDPSKHKPAIKKDFEETKKLHFHLLAQTSYLGKPWFHGQSEGLGIEDRRDLADRSNRAQFSFYTGGRAISDNLALDRELRLLGKNTDATVDVSTIPGITVKEIDWKPLLPRDEVAIDPLAMLIPEDQHVMICPSLNELNKIVDLLEKEGSPLAQSFTVRNPFRTLPQRYKKQLGIDFPPALAALLPIESVAITGYDPFYPTGTDVAILFESDKADALYKMLDKTIQTPQKNLALVGKVIVLTNSKKQLERIQSVHAGKTKSLGSLDEYKYFRHRYPAAEKSTGYVFLSDACIRRWGGPHMRIAASRRTQAIAALNNLTARQIAFSKQGALLVDNEKLNSSYLFLLGKVTATDGLITSSKMGNLHWLTPTIDMDLSKVTKAESDAYAIWRRGYEEGWAKVFDPIGFSFTLNNDTKELDLTVMPLSMNNDYQEFIKLTGKSILSSEARISADSNLMTASIALDKDSTMLDGFDRAIISLMPGLKIKSLAWLGPSATLVIEKGKHWAKLGNNKVRTEDLILGAPIALRIEHTSKLKLAMFLTALKAAIQTAAPDAVTWDTKQYGESKYVVLTSNEFGTQELKICYAISKTAITFTMREDVLKRAIDRELAEVKPKLNKIQEQADHFYINADSRFLMRMMGTAGDSMSVRRRQQSYRAIPILNEWHKLWKDKNPVAQHFQRFGEDIYCPGGKGYQWNAKEMTMESIHFGHPAMPKEVVEDSSLLDAIGHIESAMKFEHDGLRIKLKFTKRKAPSVQQGKQDPE